MVELESRGDTAVSIRWRLRNYFFTGLLVVLPLLIAVFIIWWLFSASTNLFIRFIPEGHLESTAVRFLVRVLTLAVLMVLVVIVGAVAHNVMGRKVISLGEKILARIPVFNKIYIAVKQIGEAFIGTDKTVFQNVVMVEYPRKDLFVIGFQTAESRGEIQGKTAETMVNVFVPTSPNPTSGMLIIVPKNEIIALDMSVEEGMKMVISGGTIVSEKIGRGANGSQDGRQLSL